MRAVEIDPSDITWEDDNPAFRVNFWHRPDAPPEVEPELVGYHCYSYRLVAADIHQVLAWAEERRRGSDTYTLYVEVNRSREVDGESGLVRLAGVDPTSSTG